MSWISIDIETDGPIPGDYSMVSFGAVLVQPDLQTTFYAELKPTSEKWIPEALAISGFSRADTMAFPEPKQQMQRFRDWLAEHSKGRPQFIADNNGFDWQFINWYFHHFLGQNPFGFSSTNLGSLYKGMQKDMFVNFKHLRKTPHTHNALNDAMGNAQALVALKQDYGLKIKL